jgi:CheY-like chemotaxis protein
MSVSAHSILLVEDDASFARFIIGTFRDVEPNLDLFHVNSGYAAMSVIGAGFRPDLIVCEDRMPRMNGSELLTCVRADPSCQSVPYIMLTSSFTDDVPQHRRQPLFVRAAPAEHLPRGTVQVTKIPSSCLQEAHSAAEAEGRPI